MRAKRPAGLPRAIIIALHDHECSGCGTGIKKGGKMTMRMHKLGDLYSCFPTCLKCDGRFPEFIEGEVSV